MNLPPFRPGARCLIINGTGTGQIVVLKKQIPNHAAWFFQKPIPVLWNIKNRKPCRHLIGKAQRALLPLDGPLPARYVAQHKELSK